MNNKCNVTVSLCWQNRELLEEARAAKCYRDELDIVKDKVSEIVKI